MVAICIYSRKYDTVWVFVLIKESTPMQRDETERVNYDLSPNRISKQKKKNAKPNWHTCWFQFTREIAEWRYEKKQRYSHSRRQGCSLIKFTSQLYVLQTLMKIPSVAEKIAQHLNILPLSRHSERTFPAELVTRRISHYYLCLLILWSLIFFFFFFFINNNNNNNNNKKKKKKKKNGNKILRDFKIKMDHPIPARRRHQLIINKKERTHRQVDFTVPRFHD